MSISLSNPESSQRNTIKNNTFSLSEDQTHKNAGCFKVRFTCQSVWIVPKTIPRDEQNNNDNGGDDDSANDDNNAEDENDGDDIRGSNDNGDDD